MTTMYSPKLYHLCWSNKELETLSAIPLLEHVNKVSKRLDNGKYKTLIKYLKY